MADQNMLSVKTFSDVGSELLVEVKKNATHILDGCSSADDMLYTRGVYDGFFHAFSCVYGRLEIETCEKLIIDARQSVTDCLLEKYDFLLRKAQS